MADRYPYRPDAVGARDNHSARSVESDPLAELARLIGQSDANFSQPGRAQPAAPAQRRSQHHARHREHHDDQEVAPSAADRTTPSWMRTAASTGWQQHQPAPPVHPQPDHGHYPVETPDQEYSDTPAFLRSARQHDHSRYDDVLYDQNSQNVAHQHYADQHYPDQQYQDGYPDHDHADPNGYPPFYADAPFDEPKRRRGGLTTVVAVLVLAVVGTAGAYAYRSFTGVPHNGEPPVIKAEPGANKIVPPTQTTDASGKIVDRIGGAAAGQERVLSREEQPIDISRNAPRVVFPPLNQNSNPPTLAATTQMAPPQAAANGALGDEPRRVRTVPIRPDQPDAVPSQTAAPTPPPASQRVASARAQAPEPSSTSPVSLAPQQSEPAPVRTASASPTSGGFMVQVSSQRSEADAQASFRALQAKYPDVLGSRSASIRRADLGERGIYYRAMVGPFAAADDAGQLCNSLRAAGGQCVVQRN